MMTRALPALDALAVLAALPLAALLPAAGARAPRRRRGAGTDIGPAPCADVRRAATRQRRRCTRPPNAPAATAPARGAASRARHRPGHDAVRLGHRQPAADPVRPDRRAGRARRPGLVPQALRPARRRRQRQRAAWSAALNLGGRERMLVVEVGNQWIVVGASPGRVNALATMPRQDRQAATAPATLTLAGRMRRRAQLRRLAEADDRQTQVMRKSNDSCWRRAAAALALLALPLAALAAHRPSPPSPPAPAAGRRHRLFAAGADPAADDGADLHPGGAADDDELHPHHHRAVAAAPGARHADRAAEPGDGRPGAVPDAVRDGPDVRPHLHRSLRAAAGQPASRWARRWTRPRRR